MIPNPFNLTF